MTRAKSMIFIALTSSMALAACTDPEYLTRTDDPNQQTRTGAIVGGVTGAVVGAALGDDAEERRRGALVGAVVGAGGGALIGRELDRQAAELRADLQNEARIVNTGNELIVTMPQDVLFAVDSASVRPDLQADLRTLAQSLQRYPNSTMDIIGHTDNTGSAGYNQNLSTRRAQSVEGILINAGVNPNRLRAIGRGEDVPIASNLTPEGRQQNRRVEFIIRPTAS